MNGTLKPTLDRLYDSFNMADSAVDPIQIVRRYSTAADQEIVAFCAAGLAFGRVSSVMHSIERVALAMGPSPAAFVRQFEPALHGAPLRDFVHRWIRGRDIIALLWVLRQMLERSGTIEGFFLEGDPGGEDVREALESFSSRAMALNLRAAYGRVPVRPGVGYFFPRPSGGSGCKRLNLFMRWMVRRDALDLGTWSRVSPSRLIVPLDTHIIRVGRCLKLTRYTSPGWPMALDITRALRVLDAADPVKYDFSVCHLGMMNACGFETPRGDAQCPLKGACAPRRPGRKATG
ncbi:MAG: TIGR02757 family protein [Vicinamibacterales bacterium]